MFFASRIGRLLGVFVWRFKVEWMGLAWHGMGWGGVLHVRDVRSWRLCVGTPLFRREKGEGRGEKGVIQVLGACALSLAPNGMGCDGPMIINNNNNNKSRNPVSTRNKGRIIMKLAYQNYTNLTYRASLSLSPWCAYVCVLNTNRTSISSAEGCRFLPKSSNDAASLVARITIDCACNFSL